MAARSRWSRRYGGDCLAIGRDEETEGWPTRDEHCVAACTVLVDRIAYGSIEILQHDFAADADRHGVCPRAVSIEDMISGVSPWRWLCYPECWGRSVPEAANRYRPFSVAMVHVGACSFSPAYPCSTVRSPTVTNSPIPSVHKPTCCMFVSFRTGCTRCVCVVRVVLFRGARQHSGRQDVLPLRRG